MPVTANAPAPYAPPSAIMEVINRYRGGLPAPINAEVLGRAGISDSLIPRTLQALQTLDLINEDGSPTPTLEGLRRCPEPEFQQRLTDWLNVAYADVRNFVDPATADEVAIRDAFRPFDPVGQQPRMVTLFTGLYAAAGVRPQKNATPRAPRAVSARAPRTAVPRGWEAVVKPPKADGRKHITTPGIPDPLAGMLARLPDPERGWTQADRDKFLNTFGTVLDFCFPIVTQDALDKKEPKGEE